MEATSTLPEDLIRLIVVRLPMKSVGRCRCVSTRWRSLFSGPLFAKSHFQVSAKHRAVVFLLNEELKTMDLDWSDTASFENESLRDLKAPFDHTCLGLLGSCNGLVAVRDSNIYRGGEESLFIWNPATGFFKKLPSRRHASDDFIFGFGCVSSSDEYKLVMGEEIFSSKTNSWKPIEIPGGIFRQRDGVLCGDALHWPVYSHSYQGQDLYAFNLENEEFSMMQLPKALQTERVTHHFLGDYGVTSEGCLFVMDVYPLRKLVMVVEFWVMRDYGNSDSWARSFGVKIRHPTSRLYYPLRFGAISVMETSAFVRNPYGARLDDKTSTTYYRNEEENRGIYMIEGSTFPKWEKVVYEESLYCLA